MKNQYIQFLLSEYFTKLFFTSGQGIECMPTFIFYKNGKKVDKVEGADEQSVRNLIGKHS